MNLVVMLTSKVDLADFRLSVLTKGRITSIVRFTVSVSHCDSKIKFGLFFSALYVLEIADFSFVPERNVIAFLQFLVLAPIIFASKCGVTIDPFSRLENIFTTVFINLGRSEKEKKE